MLDRFVPDEPQFFGIDKMVLKSFVRTVGACLGFEGADERIGDRRRNSAGGELRNLAGLRERERALEGGRASLASRGSAGAAPPPAAV